MMPPDPPQLPEGKEENSLVTSPFSAFEAVSRGEGFWCGGRSERVGIVGQAGAFAERELVEEGMTEERQQIVSGWNFPDRASVREQTRLLNFHSNCY